jgi:stearoyl-CoA desaturase (Delta-9 desaturase)
MESAHPTAPASASRTVRTINLLAIIIPFIGLILGAVVLWGRGFSWTQLVLLLVMYLLTTLGITLGYHRLFTHRAFQATRGVKAVLAVLGSMSVEGPVLNWVAIHRRHHQHSDRPDDPHSPHLHGKGLRGLFKGLYHAHIGWLLLADPPGLTRYIRDLLADGMLRRISKLFTLWVALGLVIPAVLGGLLTMSWMGALWGFLWAGLIRIFLLNHVTWSINSICHLWGTRPFRCPDQSRNNFVFGVLALGEGWHNNHHAFPSSARHGLRWWEIDASYWVLRALALVGLAWKVKLPSAESMSMKRRRRGAAATA